MSPLFSQCTEPLSDIKIAFLLLYANLSPTALLAPSKDNNKWLLAWQGNLIKKFLCVPPENNNKSAGLSTVATTKALSHRRLLRLFSERLSPLSPSFPQKGSLLVA